jgi:hypothetical protein
MFQKVVAGSKKYLKDFSHFEYQMTSLRAKAHLQESSQCVLLKAL